MYGQSWRPLLAALLALALLAVACSPTTGDVDTSPLPTPEGESEPASEPAPEPTPGPTPKAGLEPQAQALVEKAREDLDARLGIAPGEIRLVSIEAAQWRDSSLGCPQPGMKYLQVITPGYRIKLEAGGRVYEYHTSDERVVLCDGLETQEGEAMGPKERLVEAARADLARMLDISQDGIQVVSAQYVEWRDASLGCPKEGMMYAQVITPGYLIVLSAGGREYNYHTSMQNVMLCRR